MVSRRGWLQGVAAMVASLFVPKVGATDVAAERLKSILFPPEDVAYSRTQPTPIPGPGLKFPVGTVIVCQECKDKVATANRDIFTGEVAQSSAWDWHQAFRGDFYCDNCKASYVQPGLNGRIMLSTDKGWL